jgi:long-chain acyl-CoA synthetase
MDHLEHMGELRSGIKYSPQYIEGRLRFGKYIKNALVIGGKDRDFVSALINVDEASVRKWAENHSLPYTSILELCQKEEVAGLIGKELLVVNSYLPESAGIRRFVLLHKEFDAEEGERTRTRKRRRTFIEEKYRELIKAIYSSKGEVEVSAPVVHRDGSSSMVITSVKVWKVKGEKSNG